MMDKTHLKWHVWRIMAIGLTLGFIAASGVFAQSGKVSLSQVDQLIAEHRNNAALKVLLEYHNQYSQDQDNFDKRIKIITKAQNDFIVLGQKLLNADKDDPDYYELALSIIRQMENIEVEPNQTQSDFLRRTKEFAVFNYNNAQLAKILNEGRNFLNRNEYSSALSTYLTGTNLYRDEFYEAQYGDLVYAKVEEDLRTINQSIAEFNALQNRVLSTLSEFERIAQQTNGYAGLNNLTRVYNNLEAVTGDLMTVRNKLSNAGASLQNQSNLLKQTDDTWGDASHLPFLLRLIRGRDSETLPEGMLGTMDSLWLRVRDSALSYLTDITNSDYENALSLGKQNLFSRSEQEFNGVMGFNAMVLKTILWEDRKDGLIIPIYIVIDGEAVAENQVSRYYQFYSMSKSVPHIVAAQNSTGTLNAMMAPGFNSVWMWRDGAITPANAMQQERDILARFDNFEAEVRNRLAVLEETGNELNTIRTDTSAGFNYNIYLDEARSYYNSLLGSIAEQQRAAVERRYTIANGELDKRRAQRQAQYDEALGMINGTARESSVVLVKYPAEANVILTSLLQTIVGDIQSGNELVQQYSGERPAIGNSQEMVSLLAQARGILSNLESLRNSAQAASSQAQTMVAQANSLKLDGDRLLREAQAAMNQNNFDMARERVKRAENQYDESLKIQESASLRTFRDGQLLNIDAEINSRENAINLVQVRRLVDKAKNDFNAQNFESADDALSEAKNLHQKTNVEPNAEILYWQGIVRNALSLRSGTTIPSTAPLYSEMSQLLRDAYQAYETGANLFSQNRRTEGTARLNEAQKKLQEVRLVFPLNEEAGILSLRIDQLIDPNFVQKFQNLVEAAYQSVMSDKSVEAYTTLKNLSVINPNYPGIKNLLYQAGVQIGEIIPPPSAAAVARSDQLTASARIIVDGNVQSQYPAALEMLNEAIRLNPANNAAAQLIDRLNTRMGGTNSIMTSAAKAKYDIAVREFQNRNILVAQRLVEELLADPRNRNSSDIIELKQRIEASL